MTKVKGPGRIPVTAWNVVRDTIHEIAPEREEELVEAIVARLRGYRPAAGQSYTTRECARCGEPLAPGDRLDKIYCSDRCRIAHKRAETINNNEGEKR